MKNQFFLLSLLVLLGHIDFKEIDQPTQILLYKFVIEVVEKVELKGKSGKSEDKTKQSKKRRGLLKKAQRQSKKTEK